MKLVAVSVCLLVTGIYNNLVVLSDVSRDIKFTCVLQLGSFV